MGKYNKKTKLRSVKRERSTRRNPKKRPVYGEREVIAEAVAEEKEGTIVTPPQPEETAEKSGVLAVLNYFRSTRLSKGLGWFLSLLIDLIIIALIIWLIAGRGGDVKSAADASTESTVMEAPATTVNDNEAAVHAGEETTALIAEDASGSIDVEEESAEAPLATGTADETAAAAASFEEKALVLSHEILGSEVLFESYPEELVITYPDEWGLADVARFMNAEIERYGLFGVSYLASGENQVVLTHERIESEAEREALIGTLSSDLDEYAGSLSVSEDKTEENATVTASSGEAESATSQNTVSRTIGYGGYLVLLESHPDELVITYPAVIGLSEVYAFLEEEEERYALEGISILATGEDEVTVYHDGIESEERRAEILLTLERDLIEYLGRLSGAGTVVESLTEKEETVQITNSYEATIIQTAVEEEESEENEEWKEIRHSLSLSASPYGLFYVDFYNVEIPLPKKEFMSKYGFGAELDYEWRFIDYMSVGLNLGFYGYYTQRSIIAPNSFYYQVPLMATVRGHLPLGIVDLFLGLGAGVDLASLLDASGSYFMAKAELGVSVRVAESLSLFYKAVGGLTVQKTANRSTDSNTYVLQPAMIGLSWHI